MPGGGGPTAAETTMPFTIDWDQVRTRQEAPPLSPAPEQPGGPADPGGGLPPGARRITGPRSTPRPLPAPASGGT